MKMIDLVGQRFGRLTVLRRTDAPKGTGVWWACLCDCGAERVASTTSLRSGNTSSCGCFRVDAGKLRGAASRKHGHATSGMTVEYQAWSQMKHRCTNPNAVGWDRYGGRGIEVCPEWMTSFETFLADVGARPSDKHSLDRFPNNDGDYEPGNVRWATAKEQNNNASFNRHVTIDGVTRPLREWLELRGVNRKTFYNRAASGYTEEQALSAFAFQPGRKPRNR